MLSPTTSVGIAFGCAAVAIGLMGLYQNRHRVLGMRGKTPQLSIPNRRLIKDREQLHQSTPASLFRTSLKRLSQVQDASIHDREQKLKSFRYMYSQDHPTTDVFQNFGTSFEALRPGSTLYANAGTRSLYLCISTAER